MWCLAASVTDKFDALQEHFYHRARKYAQMDEMKGHGESTITLGHCQTWILMGTYEFKQMYFPRAWLSAGRAVRLAQMMQLHPPVQQTYVSHIDSVVDVNENTGGV